ncbi:MAG: cytochrome C [Bryobacterales bacterium]|nr:cytochrome C [Bryobacterales bacterium]
MKLLLLAVALFASAACRSDAGRPAAKQAASSEPLLEGRARVNVEGHAEVPGFAILARTAQMQKLPCNKCHTVPLAQMKPVKPAAHWNVVLKHAKPETMNCNTCHADADKGELRMMQGAPVGFDHAYKLCGQCHAAQEKDWAGGAHGKRAAGWAPPRVALSCTGCHNPHTPAFDRRWPARAGRPETTE